MARSVLVKKILCLIHQSPVQDPCIFNIWECEENLDTELERSGDNKCLKIKTFYHSRPETNKHTNSGANTDRVLSIEFFLFGLKLDKNTKEFI